MRIAIHQPNLVPWYPYFQKMKMANTFVIIGGCQFEKGGYQNRFVCQGVKYSMPVRRGLEPICHKEYCDHEAGWRNLCNRMRARNAEYADLLDSLAPCVSGSLMGTNVSIIGHIARGLGITTPIAVDNDTRWTGTERLVNICKKYGATEYIAGPSCTKYMDMKMFADAGISVFIQTEQMQNRKHVLEILCE